MAGLHDWIEAAPFLPCSVQAFGWWVWARQRMILYGPEVGDRRDQLYLMKSFATNFRLFLVESDLELLSEHDDYVAEAIRLIDYKLEELV